MIRICQNGGKAIVEQMLVSEKKKEIQMSRTVRVTVWDPSIKVNHLIKVKLHVRGKTQRDGAKKVLEGGISSNDHEVNSFFLPFLSLLIYSMRTECWKSST